MSNTTQFRCGGCGCLVSEPVDAPVRNRAICPCCNPGLGEGVVIQQSASCQRIYALTGLLRDVQDSLLAIRTEADQPTIGLPPGAAQRFTRIYEFAAGSLHMIAAHLPEPEKEEKDG